MPLFKAYLGPVTNGHELVLATQNSSQDSDIVANVRIFERDGGDQILEYIREDLGYDATDDYMTGSVFRFTVTTSDSTAIQNVAGYTRVEDNGEERYYLYEDQVSLIDYTNAPSIDEDSGTDTTSVITSTGGIYECSVTDHFEGTDSEEEEVTISGGIGVAIDGTPQYARNGTVDLTLTTAVASGSTITSVALTATGADDVENTLTLSTADTNTLTSGGSVTFTANPNTHVTPFRSVSAVYTLTINGNISSSISLSQISVPVISISTAPAAEVTTVTVDTGDTVTFTGTITHGAQNVDLRGGTYIWYVNGIRNTTTTYPTNTFSVNSDSAATWTVELEYFNRFGRTNTSNEYTVIWE